MRIYDTLTEKLKELDLSPGKGKRINIFVCGPTVYDKPHLGHARTYIFFDIFVRYLKYKGFHPFFLMNITDIDDKIINRANEEGIPFEQISLKYSREFFKSMWRLKVNSVNYYAYATDFIQEIISQVERLINTGYAYETQDGVYFDVDKFKDYGKLSHQNIEMLKAGQRVDINENKKNPLDFALWKKKKPNEPFWPSPWGDGRPGWHIEDTAITESFFGSHYDIHGGGIDLVFPHHEAEIAQMEAISNKPPLVDYWIHTGHLSVENVKMSKSLKNYITVDEVLENFWPEALRILFMSMNYRDTSNFSLDGLKSAQAVAEKIAWLKKKVSDSGLRQGEYYHSVMENITSPLDDNMSTVISLSTINSFLKDSSFSLSDKSKLPEINAILNDIDEIFGIVHSSPLPNDVIDLILNLRKEARLKGDFETSDKIRSELAKKGIKIEDSGQESFAWW